MGGDLSQDPTLSRRLRRALEALPQPTAYRVAFSGGLDSTVLLHLLASLRDVLPAPVSAVHVNHGLHPESSTWSERCRRACEQLGVPIVAVDVDARPAAGESPEAAARQVRYRAFADAVNGGEAILTAHHRGDQAETVLLQLFRGAGPRGLAGMPAAAPFADGWLLRPLLLAGLDRADLRLYAEAHALSWIEDPSNFDTGLDRNFLRHTIMPELSTHWPGLNAVLARSAGHFAEASILMDALAEQDLAACPGMHPNTLSVRCLTGLSPARARNLIRYWIRETGVPLPDSRRIERILEEVIPAPADAEPMVAWRGAEVRRYRDDLYALAPLPPIPTESLQWDLKRPLTLPNGLGRLAPLAVEGAGILASLAAAGVGVAFRQGGERCRPAGRPHGRELRKLLQEAGIPPWMRERLPLITVQGEVAQIPGVTTCEPFAAGPGEPGIQIRWER